MAGWWDNTSGNSSRVQEAVVQDQDSSVGFLGGDGCKVRLRREGVVHQAG
jgi:hypothetical protein